MSDFYVYLAACFFLFVVYGFRPGDRIKYSHIPGPPPKWLFGSLLDFRKKGFLLNLATKYGDMTKFFLGGRPNVLIGCPEIAKNVLQAFIDRDTLGGFVTGPKKRVEFERSLIPFITGDAAFRLRNSWMPAFHPKSLGNYQETMIKYVNQLIEVLDKKTKEGEVIDIHELLSYFSLDVAGSSAFGVNFGLLNNEMAGDNFKNNGHDQNVVNENLDEQMVQEMLKAIRIQFSFGLDDGDKKKSQEKKRSWLPPTPWFLFNLLVPELGQVWKICQQILPSQRKVKMLQSYDVGRAVGDELVQKARQRLESQTDTKVQQRGIEPGCFLDVMIQSQADTDPGRLAKLKDYEIAGQAWIFILAGSETTSTTLSFLTYCLATNPESEKKLLAEIDSVSEFDMEQIKGLKFLDCVIKETHRLYPPVPLVNRMTDENRMIDKYLVPKNTTLVVSNMAMHRNQKYWERPEDFFPERFLSDTEFPAYFPFGGGSRMCLGQQFAQQEIKIATFLLYKKFTFKLTAGQVPIQTRETITLSPVNGIKVTAHERVQ